MPKQKWDKEYSTQYWQEVDFLKQHGINYSFVKEANGVSTWKYTKTKKLFEVLVEFYRNY